LQLRDGREAVIAQGRKTVGGSVAMGTRCLRISVAFFSTIARASSASRAGSSIGTLVWRTNRTVLVPARTDVPGLAVRLPSGEWFPPPIIPGTFLINLGNAIALLYLLFFLQDEVGIQNPEQGVLILTVVNALTLLVAVMVAGVWSDRVGKRRVFVLWSGVIMGAAAMTLALWPVWPVALVAAAVLGIGFGAYTSVDFALLTQVLPAAVDRGKDLGVLNIASALPQVLAPVVAAPIVVSLGGYSTLYGASAVVGLVGAVLVYRIRSVK